MQGVLKSEIENPLTAESAERAEKIKET